MIMATQGIPNTSPLNTPHINQDIPKKSYSLSSICTIVALPAIASAVGILALIHLKGGYSLGVLDPYIQRAGMMGVYVPFGIAGTYGLGVLLINVKRHSSRASEQQSKTNNEHTPRIQTCVTFTRATEESIRESFPTKDEADEEIKKMTKFFESWAFAFGFDSSGLKLGQTTSVRFGSFYALFTRGPGGVDVEITRPNNLLDTSQVIPESKDLPLLKRIDELLLLLDPSKESEVLIDDRTFKDDFVIAIEKSEKNPTVKFFDAKNPKEIEDFRKSCEGIPITTL